METREQLDQIKKLLENLSSKLDTKYKWPTNGPFCHHFINLDDNVRFIHRQYPTFFGTSIRITEEREDGLAFQTNGTILDMGTYVWVSRNNEHTLMKVVSVKNNGGNNFFNFYLHELEIV